MEIRQRFVVTGKAGTIGDAPLVGNRLNWRPAISALNYSILHAFVLQIMDALGQLSQSTRLDRVLSLLEVYYCALSNSGFSASSPLPISPVAPLRSSFAQLSRVPVSHELERAYAPLKRGANV